MKTPLVYDTETTGLALHHGARMFAFSTMRVDGGLLACVRRKDRERVAYRRDLKAIWADTKLPKVMHNAKFDILATMYEGIDVPENSIIHDTMLMSKLIRSDFAHGLKQLAFALAGYPRDDEMEVKQALCGTDDYSRCPHHLMDRYQICDAERTVLLFRFFWPMVQADKQILDLYNVEIALLWVTIRMELRGMRVNVRELHRLQDDMRKQVAEIEARFPSGMNPDKKDKLAVWLFETCGFPCRVRTAKTGAPSTAKDPMLDLMTDFPNRWEIPAVLKWRSYTKGITTLSKYESFLDEQHIIRPTINTCAARTGRESCERPNLQNISKKRSLKNPFPVPARRVFQPRSGFVNLHNDYASIELLLILDASGDKAMLRIVNSGGDAHYAACKIFFQDAITSLEKNCPEWEELRSAGKNGHFALAYGGSVRRVASTLALPVGVMAPRYAEY